MWVVKLKDPGTLCTSINVKAILNHLQVSCIGFYALDVLVIQEVMMMMNINSEGVTEYIIWL